MISLMTMLDLLGTIAFAISGALTGVRHKMDIFGINILALATATGGGMIRDILIGKLPPQMFRDPFYVLISVITANVVFLMIKFGFFSNVPGKITSIYDLLFFWFDTLGMAAFTVDGVMIGLKSAYGDSLFLVVFLGVMTGVGGGVLRDVLADQMPAILQKHVYALASIVGGLVCGYCLQVSGDEYLGIFLGFVFVVVIRALAVHYNWNLPRAD